jgi:hypothetical protein
MSKNVKKAEKVVTDADKFPIESCRERIARRFGLDAVALSGPCEGDKLSDCVCKQLDQRWDRVKERFAGDKRKVVRLAVKLAESFAAKDDTDDCVKDVEKLGYSKDAAAGISGYLKAYAIDMATDNEIEGLMDGISAEGDLSDDGMGAGMDDIGDEAGCPGCAEEGADMGPDIEVVDDGAPEGMPPAGEEMVSIEIPREVLEDILGGGTDEVVPGEPAGMQDDGQFVEGVEGGDEIIDLPQDEGAVTEAGEGVETESAGAMPQMQQQQPTQQPMQQQPMQQKKPGEAEMAGSMMDKSEEQPLPTEEHAVEEKEEHDVIESLEKKLEELKSHEAKEEEAKSFPPKEEPKSDENGESKEETDEEPKKDEEGEKREAAMQLRAGHLRRVGQNILKIGPEMSINNTDQLGGHDGKKLGNAKDKSVEDPKPLPDGNVHPEGHTAGGNKFQDGGTMGHEKKFEAHEVTKDEVSGGSKSLLGKDESFPEGKPEVPAGSAPIGGEQFQGGDLSMKGTVIATFTPKGLVIETPDGKKLLAKADIKSVSTELAEAIGKIKYDGDARKFAGEALSLIKKEAKTKTQDGCTMTDTSKLEGSNFTNDAKKKPDDGGAMTEKGSPAKSDEGITKTDTSKKESEHFTNDADKKAEAAAVSKETKTAGDKKVEDPKPLPDGNVKPEGHTAGGNKFQDGGTMGHEEKFDAKEVKPDDVSGGEKSLMGKDESLPKDKPEVPAGGGKMGNEEHDGGDVSTKGTVIAEVRKAAEAEAKIREARILAASAYAADLLKNGEISGEEFASTVEKIAAMPVQAIQSLQLSTRKAREKVAACNTALQAQSQTKTAGLSIPVVISSSSKESSLTERLVNQFKLTKQLNALDQMREKRE